MINSLLKRWDKYWFTSTNRYQYGLFRILLVGGLFLVAWDAWNFYGLEGITRAPVEFTQPVFLAQVFHFPISIPPEWLSPLRWILRILVFTSFIGLGTRPSLIALAGLNLYLNTLLNSFGFIDHATTLPSLVLVVLAFAPGVDQLSVDSLITYVRKKGLVRPPKLSLFEGSFPIWPANLILVIMAFAYFTSGFSKVRFGTVAWMDGQTLAAYLSEPHPVDYFSAALNAPDSAKWKDGAGLVSFIYSTGQPTPLAKSLAQIPLAMLLLSSFSVLWEITFPIVLVFRRLLPLYLLGGIAFHVGIMATLSLYSFYSYILCYLLFVDWKRLTQPLIKRLQPVSIGSP